MIGGAPTGGQILIGMFFVVGGCIAAAVSAELVRRTRNWLYLICVAGAVAVVAGVVGQRSPAVDQAGNRLVQGPWDAAVAIPVLNLQAAPVALGGVLVGLVGLALVLFFEPTPDPDRKRADPVARPLEEDDAV